MDEKPERENEFDITKCVCDSVVVYLDRAEVCRSLKTTLKTGDNEVILTNMSNFLDQDSIRVEGKGPATINEVTFQSRFLTPQEQPESKDKVEELRNSIKDAQKKEGILMTKLRRLQKQRTTLDNFADSMSKPSAVEPKGQTTLPLDSMKSFFDLFDDQATKLDESIHGVEDELKELREEIAALNKNLLKIQGGEERNEAREVSILLEATEEAEVTLSVSYVVAQASWSPKYDIRVFSDEKVMKVLYYGIIKQSTGEDWENAKLSLSTAMPSIGGTVPELGTEKLKFLVPRPPVYRAKKKMKGIGMPSFRMKKSRMMENAYMDEACDFGGSDESEESLRFATSEVKESITSTIYEIARPSTIPADNIEHKVSVAIIDLKPNFHYQCVPKKSTFAYLTAKVKNTSQYAMLAGPTNIFLDNNFIAKASLKAVSPGEEFTCSLGVDQAIKVTYLPVHKYREQSGLWSKVQTTTYKQITEIHNKHQIPANVTVTDHLPQSMEEKIKVHLQEPVIKPHEKGPQNPCLNKNHNIEWDMEIAAGKTATLTLKYAVEVPADKQIDSTEVFP